MLRLMTVSSVEEKILAAARKKLNVDEKVRTGCKVYVLCIMLVEPSVCVHVS